MGVFEFSFCLGDVIFEDCESCEFVVNNFFTKQRKNQNHKFLMVSSDRFWRYFYLR